MSFLNFEPTKPIKQAENQRVNSKKHSLPLPSFDFKKPSKVFQQENFIPQTPCGKKRKITHQPDIFPGSKPENTDRSVLKQQGSKSCGGFSLHMLLTDVKGKKHTFSDEFISWRNKAYLYDANNLEKGAKLEDVELKTQEVNPKNFIKELKETLDKTNHPVILSITNPKIEGHFIVVDKVDDKHVTIRDPYTGKCLKMDHETFMKNSVDNENPFGTPNEKCLYVPK